MADIVAGLQSVTEEVWLDAAGQEPVTERGPVSLTSLAFRLLRYFLGHPGAVVAAPSSSTASGRLRTSAPIASSTSASANSGRRSRPTPSSRNTS